jgi:hypothetical protein
MYSDNFVGTPFLPNTQRQHPESNSKKLGFGQLYFLIFGLPNTSNVKILGDKMIKNGIGNNVKILGDKIIKNAIGNNVKMLLIKWKGYCTRSQHMNQHQSLN